MSDIEYERGAAAATRRMETEPLRLARLIEHRANLGQNELSLGQVGVSARLASAQFTIAARVAADGSQALANPPITGPDARPDSRPESRPASGYEFVLEDAHPTPTMPLGRVLQVLAPSSLQVAPMSAHGEIVPVPDDAELRLPAAWYAKPQTSAVATMGLSQEQHAHVIRGVAAACLTTAAGLLIWLSTMTNAPPSAPPTAASSTLISSFAPNLAAVTAPIATAPIVPEPRAALASPSQDQISTAQILAVAERFIATGDILAARAMLQDRAGSGEPRALFALAETYDPHMLSSWAARDADPSVTYARFLYEAARRGGVADAQTRIDALK